MRPTLPTGLGVGSAVRRLAERAGLTEGQAYTLVIGLVLGLVTASIGIPPTLRDGLAPLAGGRAAASAPPGTGAVAAPEGQAGAESGQAPPTPDLGGAAGGLAGPSSNGSFGTAGGSAGSPDGAAGGPAGQTTGSEPEPSGGGGIRRVAAVAAGTPGGIAVDASSGDFYVATDGPGSSPSTVVRFARTGDVEREYEVQGQPATRARGVPGLALDGDGGLLVADASSARVLRIALDSGAQRVLATIPDVAPCVTPSAGCELSPRNGPPVLHALVLDEDGSVFVADAGQGIIWRIRPGGKPELWLRDAQLLSPEGRGPAGIVFDRDGDLLVVVSRSILALTGTVLRVPVGESGEAKAPGEIYRSDPQVDLAGITVSADGRIVVAATGADALLVLDREGTLVRTVTAPELIRPMGVARRGQAVFVTAGDDVVARVPMEG